MIDPQYYEMSRAEVGRELGLSEGMVHYIEKRALEKLRIAFIRRGLRYQDLTSGATAAHVLANLRGGQ